MNFFHIYQPMYFQHPLLWREHYSRHKSQHKSLQHLSTSFLCLSTLSFQKSFTLLIHTISLCEHSSQIHSHSFWSCVQTTPRVPWSTCQLLCSPLSLLSHPHPNSHTLLCTLIPFCSPSEHTTCTSHLGLLLSMSSMHITDFGRINSMPHFFPNPHQRPYYLSALHCFLLYFSSPHSRIYKELPLSI